MPRYSSIVMNLPGKDIGAIVVSILRPLGFSAIELEAARRTAIRVFNNRLYINMRQLVYPAVRKRLPVRTGRLRRSFRMMRAGDNAVFKAIWYGQQRIIRPRPRQSVQAVIVEEFARRGNPVIGQAIQAALDAT